MNKIFVLLGLLLLLVGCSSNAAIDMPGTDSDANTNDNVGQMDVSHDPALEPEPEAKPGSEPWPRFVESGLSADEFMLSIGDVQISDTIDLSSIFKNLNIDISGLKPLMDDPCIQWIIGASNEESQRCNWYQVNYPSKDSADFTLEFVHNTETEEVWLVRLKLFQVPSPRGIRVGDAKEKLLETYKDVPFLDDLGYIIYQTRSNQLNEDGYKQLIYSLDEEERHIYSMYIDYCFDDSLEVLGLYTLSGN